MATMAVKLELSNSNAAMARVYAIFNETHSFTVDELKDERVRRLVKKGKMGEAKKITDMSMLRYAFTEKSLKDEIEQIIGRIVVKYDIQTDVEFLVVDGDESVASLNSDMQLMIAE